MSKKKKTYLTFRLTSEQMDIWFSFFFKLVFFLELQSWLGEDHLSGLQKTHWILSAQLHK